MQNFGGQMRCIMGDVQVANTGSNQNKAKHSWQKNARYIRILCRIVMQRAYADQNLQTLNKSKYTKLGNIIDCMGSSPR